MADNMALMLLGFKDYNIEGIEDAVSYTHLVPDPRIAPGVCAVKHHDLIALVQNNVSGLCCHLAVAGGKAFSQRPDLFKAGIIPHLELSLIHI